ncbi:hypothetical protein ACA910_017748 [Epithemia clementina (nom. ined.)]
MLSVRIFATSLIILRLTSAFLLLCGGKLHNFQVDSRTLAFQSVVESKRATTATVFWAGGGFGGGSSSSSRSTKSKSKKKSDSNNIKKGTTTTTQPTAAPFDANAALLRLEKKFDELSESARKRMANFVNEDADLDVEEDFLFSENVVAVRQSADQSTAATVALSDWVPVAVLLLCLRPSVNEEVDRRFLLKSAVSLYCRELAQVAVLGSRVFANVPRNKLQYSVEPLVSFDKFVYDNILESDQKAMSNAEARTILGLDTNSGPLDESTLKRAYRTLSMEFHPDRLIGQSEDQQIEATHRYMHIKYAYETLQAKGTLLLDDDGKATNSWYESLGGRQRTDFWKFDQEALFPIATAQANLEQHKIQSALKGLDPDTVQAFVARNSRRRQ